MIIIEIDEEIFHEVLHGKLDFSSDPWPSISESAKDLVKKMLVRDPSKRITAHEVLCKFHHFFFLHYDPGETYFIFSHYKCHNIDYTFYIFRTKNVALFNHIEHELLLPYCKWRCSNSL